MGKKRLTPAETASRYNLIAERFNGERSATYGLDFADRFCALLPTHALVLDAGCGAGIPITSLLVERKYTVHALDSSDEMIALAKQNVTGATFFAADILTWTSTAKYDGAIAWDSIFHLTVENQQLALERMVGMLKPSGVGMITCGVTEGEINSSMFGQEFYYSSPSVERYIEWIEALGCGISFSEIDDPTGDGHAVICFRKSIA